MPKTPLSRPRRDRRGDRSLGVLASNLMKFRFAVADAIVTGGTRAS